MFKINAGKRINESFPRIDFDVLLESRRTCLCG